MRSGMLMLAALIWLPGCSTPGRTLPVVVRCPKPAIDSELLMPPTSPAARARLLELLPPTTPPASATRPSSSP